MPLTLIKQLPYLCAAVLTARSPPAKAKLWQQRGDAGGACLGDLFKTIEPKMNRK